jgi:hypothetical protein
MPVGLVVCFGGLIKRILVWILEWFWCLPYLRGSAGTPPMDSQPCVRRNSHVRWRWRASDARLMQTPVHTTANLSQQTCGLSSHDDLRGRTRGAILVRVMRPIRSPSTVNGMTKMVKSRAMPRAGHIAGILQCCAQSEGVLLFRLVLQVFLWLDMYLWDKTSTILITDPQRILSEYRVWHLGFVMNLVDWKIT